MNNDERGRCTRKTSARRRIAGVTLIEMMIGFVILSLVLGLGWPSFIDWLQNSQIRTAADSLQNGLHLARTEAVRRNARVSFTMAGNDWSVDDVTAVQQLQHRSGTEGTPNATVAASQNAVTFNGMGRITPLPASIITFNVTNPKGGTCQVDGGTMRCLNVTVLVGGAIRLCDPALPTSNPQAC